MYTAFLFNEIPRNGDLGPAALSVSRFAGGLPGELADFASGGKPTPEGSWGTWGPKILRIFGQIVKAPPQLKPPNSAIFYPPGEGLSQGAWGAGLGRGWRSGRSDDSLPLFLPGTDPDGREHKTLDYCTRRLKKEGNEPGGGVPLRTPPLPRPRGGGRRTFSAPRPLTRKPLIDKRPKPLKT